MSEMSIEELVKEAVEDIKEQVFLNRGTRVSNELQNRRHADIAWPGQWQGLQGAGGQSRPIQLQPREKFLPSEPAHSGHHGHLLPSQKVKTVISRIDSRLKAGAYLLGGSLQKMVLRADVWLQCPHQDKILERKQRKQL